MDTKKFLSAIVTILVVGGFLGWEFGVKASIEKKKQWEGTVTEAYRERKW